MKISLRHILSNTLIIMLPQGFIQHTHDPVIAHEGDAYYVFSTGSRIPLLCSKDKVNWEFCGRVFEKDPAWVREINPNLVDLWAPDISYFNDQWHLYYAASNFGSQNSAIGLATNMTLNPTARITPGLIMVLCFVPSRAISGMPSTRIW
jgi:arabinan endo-1,5-alpha-L-arabinosidase